MEKTIFPQTENKELDSKLGVLVVITAASGAGKDAVMEDFLKNPFVNEYDIKQVITCTDRPPRPNETRDVQYHFVTTEKLQEMEKAGELAEPIKNYGESNKATPKKEIGRFVEGESLIWRIDPSLASQVASGEFFKREFPENADILQKHTIVIFITAPKKIIENRRKARDGEKYEKNLNDYRIRDAQDEVYLNILQKDAVPIMNLDGKLNETVSSVINHTKEFYDEIKKDGKITK